MGRRCGAGEPGPVPAAGRGCCSCGVTPLPPPWMLRDQSRTDRGTLRVPPTSGKGETASREGRRAERRFSPTPPRHFAPGWGEALPSPGDVNFLGFFLQSRGERFNFKGENKTRRFFFCRQGQVGRGMRRRGRTRPGAALAPRDVQSISLCWDRVSGCPCLLLRGIWGAVPLSLERKKNPSRSDTLGTVRILEPLTVNARGFFHLRGGLSPCGVTAAGGLFFWGARMGLD